jgi:hypothetical protein
MAVTGREDGLNPLARRDRGHRAQNCKRPADIVGFNTAAGTAVVPLWLGGRGSIVKVIWPRTGRTCTKWRSRRVSSTPCASTPPAAGAGEATSLVLLTAAALGLASCPVTEPTEIAETRDEVRSDVFGDTEFPQMLIRVGWAPINADPLRSSPRRPLSEIVTWMHGSPNSLTGRSSQTRWSRTRLGPIWLRRVRNTGGGQGSR